jgi:putative acetyltransferase
MEIRLVPATDSGPPLLVRRARFEDVPEILRLIARAVEHGCRDHYGPAQRRAVYVTYARSLYVDVLDWFDTLAAERDGDLVAVAQLDPGGERLRALFVDAPLQKQGVGRALLAHVVDRATVRGCSRIQGAMSSNAVPFYSRAGFRPCRGADRLIIGGVHVPVSPMEKLLPRRR